MKPKGGQGTIVAAIRDLRVDIQAGLLSQANVLCWRNDVILRDKYGYHFTESLSVHNADQPGITDITGIDDVGDVPNV